MCKDLPGDGKKDSLKESLYIFLHRDAFPMPQAYITPF
jgi:hypothetical protein